jgi:hypothetical protein
MVAMDATADSPAAEIVSAVSDLREAPLQTLMEKPSPQVDGVTACVLDIEGDGFIAVAAFNASI